jgi:hypothetical protein
MRVKITGYIDVDTTDVDGMSDMDWAVMSTLENIFMVGFENADDFYAKLNMRWEDETDAEQQSGQGLTA